MRVLVTAGSTQVPIDEVRVVTNIFKGRTGADIATYLAGCGWDVQLLTSNPDLPLLQERAPSLPKLHISEYRTFDDLAILMEAELCHRSRNYDVVIHSAAVSDFLVDSVEGAGEHHGKIASSVQDLVVRFKPAPKLIDKIRQPWGFTGTLVKFKLEVGLSDEKLIARARESMQFSGANFLIANCLEWSTRRALLVKSGGDITELDRVDLSREIFKAVCERHEAEQ